MKTRYLVLRTVNHLILLFYGLLIIVTKQNGDCIFNCPIEITYNDVSYNNILMIVMISILGLSIPILWMHGQLMPDIPYRMYGKHTIQGMAERGNLETLKRIDKIHKQKIKLLKEAGKEIPTTNSAAVGAAVGGASAGSGHVMFMRQRSAGAEAPSALPSLYASSDLWYTGQMANPWETPRYIQTKYVCVFFVCV